MKSSKASATSAPTARPAASAFEPAKYWTSRVLSLASTAAIDGFAQYSGCGNGVKVAASVMLGVGETEPVAVCTAKSVSTTQFRSLARRWQLGYARKLV